MCPVPESERIFVDTVLPRPHHVRLVVLTHGMRTHSADHSPSDNRDRIVSSPPWASGMYVKTSSSLRCRFLAVLISLSSPERNR